MTTIHLEPANVPTALRGAYAGKSFKVEVTESAFIPRDAGLWSEGSRDLYKAIDLSSGTEVSLPGQSAAPWDSTRADRRVPLKSGFAIVRHTIFCGRDMGLTFYVHPANAAALLPAPTDIFDTDKIVLNATRAYKSSYMGQDRYDMAKENARYGADFDKFPSRAQWDDAKASLIERGMLNKAGAITVKGRNAIA